MAETNDEPGRIKRLTEMYHRIKNGGISPPNVTQTQFINQLGFEEIVYGGLSLEELARSDYRDYYGNEPHKIQLVFINADLTDGNRKYLIQFHNFSERRSHVRILTEPRKEYLKRGKQKKAGKTLIDLTQDLRSIIGGDIKTHGKQDKNVVALYGCHFALGERDPEGRLMTELWPGGYYEAYGQDGFKKWNPPDRARNRNFVVRHKNVSDALRALQPLGYETMQAQACYRNTSIERVFSCTLPIESIVSVMVFTGYNESPFYRISE